MVGRATQRGGIDAVSNALISLLREGGQWDEMEDKRPGSSIFRKGEMEDDLPLTPRGNRAVSLSPSNYGASSLTLHLARQLYHPIR